MSDFRQEGMIGYPVYKLIRAVNRQYPNNGFINYVDVREDMYDSYEGQLIDEDLRDLINEAISETYIHIARDEVFTFPTVPGQREYVLPDDCDLRDIQEVVRRGIGRPFVPPPYGLQKIFTMTFYPNGGTGTMEPIEANIGDAITLPECTFTPPTGETFLYWDVGGSERQPGDEVEMYQDMTVFPVWSGRPDPGHDINMKLVNATPSGGNTNMTFVYEEIGEEPVSRLTETGGFLMFSIPYNQALSTRFTKIEVYNRDNTLNTAVNLNNVYTESVILEFTQHADSNTPDPQHDDVVSPGDDNGGASPVVEPDPETPADNGGGGNGDNPLENTEVTPIDNGDGGNGGNPLDGDDNNGGSTPAVEPDPEEPIG